MKSLELWPVGRASNSVPYLESFAILIWGTLNPNLEIAPKQE